MYCNCKCTPDGHVINFNLLKVFFFMLLGVFVELFINLKHKAYSIKSNFQIDFCTEFSSKSMLYTTICSQPHLYKHRSARVRIRVTHTI